MARKKLQKFFALLLTFSMSMSLLSVGAFAAENDGGEKIQLSSVTLPDDSPAEIDVAFGTSEEDLNLPDYVLGTVEQEEVPPVEDLLPPEVPAVEGEGDVVQNPDGSGDAAQNPDGSGDAAQNPGDSGDTAQNPDGSGDAAQNPGDSGDTAQNPDGSGDAAQNPGDSGDTAQNPGDSGDAAQNPGDSGDTAQNPGDSDDAAQNPGDSGDTAQNPGDSGDVGDAQQGSQENTFSATDTKMDPAPEDTEDSEEIPVTWTCETGYTGWVAGTYEFTAQLDSRYAYEGSLPTVTVTVADQAKYVAEINGTQYETLQKAMNAAVSGDTITLLGNVFEGTTAQLLVGEENGPDNPFELTLDLNGNKILCGNLGETSSFSFAIFTATKYGTDGKLGTLFVKNGTFEGATDEGFAASGAISSTGDLVLENCTFENTSSQYWGAVTARDQIDGTNVTVRDCQFINNTSTGGIGGALSVESNLSTTLENVTFTGNNAYKSGGAVYVESGSLTVNDCDFEKNSASRYGGGIYLCNTTASNTTLDISGSQFEQNSSGYGGGAVAVYAPENTTSTLTVTDSKMSSNRAPSGGAVYLNGVVYADIAADFERNTATSSGGAIYSPSGTLTVTGDLTGNHADYDGGAIYAQTETVTVNGNLTDNSAGRDGGAICLYQYGLTLNGDATGNSAGRNGGAIYSIWSTVDLNGTVSGNSATGNGGGVYTAANEAGELYDGKINLLDASVYNNTADEEGADIWQGSGNQMDLKEVGSDWVLEECGHDIDGWYYDEADARWSAEEKPLSAWEFTEFERNGIAMVDYSVALRAAHGLIPVDPEDPNLPDWEISKSKTATNLDDNYESQVTLSLPAAGYSSAMDVVFVVDGTAGERWNDYKDQISSVINDLSTLQNVTVRAGLVTFGNQATSRIALQDLQNGGAEAFSKMPSAIGPILNHWIWSWMESSGTNIQAGVRAGREMLANNDNDAEKYLILLTDGGAFYWLNEAGDSVTKPYKSGNFFDSTAQEDTHIYNGNLDGMFSIASGSFDAFREQYKTEMAAFNLSATTCTKGSAEADLNGAYVYTPSDWNNKELYPFTNMEQGTYNASQEMLEAAAEGIHLITVGAYDYYPEQKAAHTLSNLFLDWTEEVGGLYRINTDNADETMDAAFEGVCDELIQLVDSGSKVVDVIGYGTDNKGNEYDFDFVNDISTLTLTVNGEELPARELDVTDGFFTGSHETACYVFGDLRPMSLTSGYPFALHYYANGEDGQSDECFVWEINVAVTKDTPVELTYSVKLTNPQTADGTYGHFDADGSEHFDSLLTNLSAVLYPVDSNGDQGMPEYFAKPTVSYTNTTPGGGGGGGGDDDDDDDDDGGTNIPDENTPTTDVPGTDIPDENTPTTDVPGTDLEDPDVPLADVPKTGDMSALWLALSALSGTGLAGVTFLGRKKRDEE